MISYYLKYLDVEHKFVDDTKTTVELMVKHIGFPDMVLAYVHTAETIEECKLREDYYIDLMLNAIKENIDR